MKGRRGRDIPLHCWDPTAVAKKIRSKIVLVSDGNGMRFRTCIQLYPCLRGFPSYCMFCCNLNLKIIYCAALFPSSTVWCPKCFQANRCDNSVFQMKNVNKEEACASISFHCGDFVSMWRLSFVLFCACPCQIGKTLLFNNIRREL